MSEAKEGLEDAVDKMKFGAKKIGSKMDDADKHTKDKINNTHSILYCILSINFTRLQRILLVCQVINETFKQSAKHSRRIYLDTLRFVHKCISY